MSWCDITSGSEHEGKGVLCRRDCIARGGIHDNHSMSACCFPIDVIHTDACAADGLEPGAASDDLSIRLGLGPDDKCIVVPDNFHQLVGLGTEIRDKVGRNVGVVVQEGDPMFTDGVRDKDTARDTGMQRRSRSDWSVGDPVFIRGVKAAQYKKGKRPNTIA